MDHHHREEKPQTKKETGFKLDEVVVINHPEQSKLQYIHNRFYQYKSKAIHLVY